MLDKYRTNFESLSEDEAVLIATTIADRYPEPPTELPEEITGEGVFNMCEVRGLDQAAVVMSMARNATATGVSALEKLVGRPIQRRAATASKPRAQRGPRPVLRDDRVIRVLVDKNPKKAGSRAHDKFALYRDGMTVSEYREAGGTADEIKWDAERSFIRVEDRA